MHGTKESQSDGVRKPLRKTKEIHWFVRGGLKKTGTIVRIIRDSLTIAAAGCLSKRGELCVFSSDAARAACHYFEQLISEQIQPTNFAGNRSLERSLHITLGKENAVKTTRTENRSCFKKENTSIEKHPARKRRSAPKKKTAGRSSKREVKQNSIIIIQ